jgi:L-threonylcarbamoyladenylate synthase
MTRLTVNPSHPDRGVLEGAARIIRSGGIVGFPTDTLYGLAVDPFSAGAVQRVIDVKGRRDGQPLPLVARDLAQVVEGVGVMSALACALAARFWPGPLTLVVPALPRIAAAVTGGTGRVGVRVPAHAVARDLCDACGHPVTATSANLSGAPAAVTADEMAASVGGVDLLLDGGPAPGGLPSTVVAVSDDGVRLVRSGAVSWEEVKAWAGRS